MERITMLKRLIVVSAALLITACGSGEILVSVEHAPQPEVHALAERYEGRSIRMPLSGYAVWEDTPEGRRCDITIVPPEDFRHIIDYHRLLGEEFDHCLRGDIHEPWE